MLRIAFTAFLIVVAISYVVLAEQCKDEVYCKDLVASVPDCSHLKPFEREKCPLACKLCVTEQPPTSAPDNDLVYKLLLNSDYTSLYRLLGFPNTTVEMGNLRGVQQAGVNVFYGVPYAQPPVGALRFRKPMPHTGWTGIRDATVPSYRCMQETGDISKSEFSEDCLTLNIYSPSQANTTQSFPVVVYFHGGNLLYGSSTTYDARSLALDANVVVVTANYRLGFFGFLSSGNDIVKGNFGLYDQRLALQWVKEHVALFHGNPNAITIVGYSAGGSCVSAQIMSPLNNASLFRRAIILGAAQTKHADVEKQRENYQRVLDLTFCKNSSDELSCLRSKSAEEIVRITTEIQSRKILEDIIHFNYGENFLPGLPEEFSSWAPNVDQYKVVFGLDELESLKYIGLANFNVTITNAAALILKDQHLSQSKFELMSTLMEFNYKNYVESDPKTSTALSLLNMLKDWSIVVPSITFADKLRQLNVTTYFLRLDQPGLNYFLQMKPQRLRINLLEKGLPGRFFSVSSILSQDGDDVSKMLIGALEGFLRMGNITLPESNVHWNVYDPTTMDTLVIGSSYSMQQNYYRRARDLWKNVVPYVINDLSCDDATSTPVPPTNPPEQCADLEEYLAWKEEYVSWLSDYKTWKAEFQKYKKLADEGKACRQAE